MRYPMIVATCLAVLLANCHGFSSPIAIAGGASPSIASLSLSSSFSPPLLAHSSSSSLLSSSSASRRWRSDLRRNDGVGGRCVDGGSSSGLRMSTTSDGAAPKRGFIDKVSQSDPFISMRTTQNSPSGGMARSVSNHIIILPTKHPFSPPSPTFAKTQK